MRDPNRFADGVEAASIGARIQHDEAELVVLQQKLDFADEATRVADARFLEAEENYKLQKSLRDDALAYAFSARRRRDAQRVDVQKQRAFLHPVRKAPLEVLGHIFELCIEDASVYADGCPSPSCLLDGQLQPFVLAAVCRRWRSASLSSPRAWAHIELTFRQKSFLDGCKWNTFVDLHISRSGAASTVLVLRRGSRSRDYHRPVTDKLLSVVMRCSSIYIHFKALDQNDAFRPLLTARAPRLQHAHIFIREGTPAAPGNVRFLTGFTSLRSLHADGLFDLAPTTLRHLKTLTLSAAVCSPTRNDISQILEAATSLTTLVLEYFTISLGTGSLTAITLSSIAELVITASDRCALQDLACLFDFPNLRRLTLFGETGDAECRLSLLQALSRKCPLRLVDVGRIGPKKWMTLVDTLCSIPLLKSVYIAECDFTADMLIKFCDALLSSDGMWPVPRLRSLKLDDCTFSLDCDPEVVLEVVRARLRVPEPFAEDEEPPAVLSKFLVSGWKPEGRCNLQEEIDALISAAAAEPAEELTGQDPILALLTADTPRLKEASIFVPEHPSLPFSFQLFPHAPALLGLIGDGVFDFAPAALRSAERLAFVSTSSLRVRDDALRALFAAANVKTLELVNITIAPDPSVGTRVILPSLTHLEIGISNDQPLANLLQAVDFPKLSVLLVNGQYRNAKCRLDLLRDLSSAYRLTGVEVDYIGPEHWQSFLGTLRTMAHLKNLIIPTCALRHSKEP
ncbi:hypothetical protein EXIGLDRAFT_760413 [Exidia glandulosa HHB12029]|uniref:F-box domain-containing protein n=1 Tax=Exidia glandulosa HHB12029 TaxID=1314781 RepID=A0A165P8R1_EXIGL|nr:hypothetical protein EXIGLDRAFT_760413 [Exidia glandulosa HHB12029]